MKHATYNPGAVVVVGLFLLLTIPAMAAPATAQSSGQSNDVIRACTRQVGVRKEVTMIVMADTCEPGWTLMEWNVQGPAGDPGPQGDPGPKGDSGDSRWQLSGPNAYYIGGNVGINTNSPNTLLHVNGTGQ